MARDDINAGSQPAVGTGVRLGSYTSQPDPIQDPWPISYPQLGAGSLRTVIDPADRNAISHDMRQEGMMVYLESDQSYYRLLPDLVTWELLLFTGSSVANFIRRPFVNEVQLVFTGIDAPLVQVYLEDPDGLFRPFLYGDETAVYGVNEYNQASIPAEYMWSHEQTRPQYLVQYAPTHRELVVSFDQPQTGTVVITF